MKLKFLGGAGEVGRSGMVMSEGRMSVLCDYGMLPTKPPKFPLAPPHTNKVLLSHSHVDHCGMAPVAVARHGAGIVATPPTKDVSLLLIQDSLKIMRAEGYPLPYGDADVEDTERAFETARFGEEVEIGGWKAALHHAGHIPGATMFEILSKRSLVYTGDIHTQDQRLVAGCRPVKCDILAIEGTYAGRDHPKRSKIEYELLDKIEEVVSRGGKVILPAFAVGRTQELMLILRGTGYDVRVDGMGKTVTKIYLQHQSYVRDARKLRKASSEVSLVKGAQRRKAALNAEVIITTSGMLDGGPVLDYISRLREDPKSAILLTGYQVEGTNGRRLLDSRQLVIDDELHHIGCEIGFFDLSAHAGHSDLVRFIRDCNPDKVVLMHSDNRQALADALGDRYELVLPETGVEVEV